MKNMIGRYNGRKVYRTTLPEYVNGRYYKNEEDVYLIDTDLIFRNEIIASYDGKYVSEYDLKDRATYYTIPVEVAKTANKEKNETEIPSSTGTAEEVLAGLYDTDYSKYFGNAEAILNSVFER